MHPQDLGIGELFQRVREAVIVADAQTQRIVLWNPAAEGVFGYSPSEALELRVEALVPGHLKDRHRAGIARYRETGHGPYIDSHALLELPALKKGGDEIRVEMSLSPIGPVDAAAGAGERLVLAVVRDVTERKRAEEKISELNETLEARVSQRTRQLEAALAELRENQERLRESERRFRSLVQNASDIIMVIEADGTVRYVSPAVERVLGYLPEELIGTSAFELYHPDDADRGRRDFGKSLEISGVGPPREIKLRRKDGSPRHVELVRNNLLDDPEVAGIVVTCHDVTERKALEEQLTHQALHDPLTGLPNRALLMDRLGHSLARAERQGSRVAVLFMDLDNFKVVNDSLGHDVGDRLLTRAAERVRACLRSQDTLARWGGDEFVVLLDGIRGPADAVRIAGRISEELKAPFDLEGRGVFATASIGIAMGGPGVTRRPAARQAAADLVRDADVAMYRAKNAGKARYAVFEERMGRKASERLTLEGDLRRAIERGEFVLHYQPKVLLEHGRNYVRGVEALLRWEHPERGLLFPGEFIGLAEETGLIVPIGRWVLREALGQARLWQQRYPLPLPLIVGVNLSARQFRSPSLVEDVIGAIEGSGIDPSSVELEITESMAMQDASFALDTVNELKEVGVRVSFDDFGTGYSSLSYLARFPADALKIDRSFVARIGKRSEDALLVRTIIDLGHDLGLKVIAEGVETAEQLKLLRRMGCYFAQGYYFSRAVPAQVANALLAKGTLP